MSPCPTGQSLAPEVKTDDETVGRDLINIQQLELVRPVVVVQLNVPGSVRFHPPKQERLDVAGGLLVKVS